MLMLVFGCGALLLAILGWAAWNSLEKALRMGMLNIEWNESDLD